LCPYPALLQKMHLRTLLSNSPNDLSSALDTTQVSEAWVNTGLTSVLYISSLIFVDISNAGLCLTYKTGSGFNKWILLTLYTHKAELRATQRCCYLHTLHFTRTQTLGFSVFTSRVLAMDLYQSHCHFKSHLKSSFHSLIPFLSLFCSCQFRTLDSIPLLLNSYPSRLVSQNFTQFYAAPASFENLLYNHFLGKCVYNAIA
jgi:hypothetical protein